MAVSYSLRKWPGTRMNLIAGMAVNMRFLYRQKKIRIMSQYSRLSFKRGSRKGVN